jgi:hypothetical protein
VIFVGNVVVDLDVALIGVNGSSSPVEVVAAGGDSIVLGKRIILPELRKQSGCDYTL